MNRITVLVKQGETVHLACQLQVSLESLLYILAEYWVAQ